MFFENDNLRFKILDVLYFNQNKYNNFQKGRNFSALSYRIEADTVITVKGEDFKFHGNEITFVPSNLDYNRKSIRDEMIVIHLDIKSNIFKRIETFLPENTEYLKELFEELYTVFSEKNTGYRYESDSILYKILAECYRQNYKPSHKESPISASVNYLNDHFTSPDLKITQISEKSFMSDVYFRKLFKKEYGITPSAYLINLRLSHAEYLISTGYYTLKEVARLSGYEDYTYFSSEFKRIKGISPKEYKKSTEI